MLCLFFHIVLHRDLTPLFSDGIHQAALLLFFYEANNLIRRAFKDPAQFFERKHRNAFILFRESSVLLSMPSLISRYCEIFRFSMFFHSGLYKLEILLEQDEAFCFYSGGMGHSIDFVQTQ